MRKGAEGPLAKSLCYSMRFTVPPRRFARYGLGLKRLPGRGTWNSSLIYTSVLVGSNTSSLAKKSHAQPIYNLQRNERLAWLVWALAALG